MNKQVGKNWSKGRRKPLMLLLCMAFLASSCTLAEGNGYAIKPQGLGITVVIHRGMTEQLLAASDAVKAGVNIDAILKDRDINTTCPKLGSRYNGDLCAFRILDAVKITGSLAFIYNSQWDRATASGELDDFRNDTMAPVRITVAGCAAVSIGTSANWTTRAEGDSACANT